MAREARHRSLTFKSLLLTALVTAGALTPLALALDAPASVSARSTPVTPLCAAPVDVRGVGTVCPRDGGLFEIVRADGSSGGFTHGPDPVPSGYPHAYYGGPTRAPVCADPVTDAFRAIVIYARAVDDDDNYDWREGVVRHLVERSNFILSESAARAGTTADLRVECDADGHVRVHEAVLATPMSQATFTTIQADLLKLGFADPRTKLWVFYDDPGACACGGMGHVFPDSTGNVLNSNNGNGEYPQLAVTFGYHSVRVMLHELGHTLGAVIDGSPHGTGAAHCWDGSDIMCYNDGGPRGWLFSTRHCSGMPFDCGNDDYFHADPPAGSFLDKYWNLANPANRFVRGCFEGNALTAPGLPVTFQLPDACRGHRAAAWVVDAATERSVLHDVELCWRDASGALIECTANALEPFPLYPFAPFKDVHARVPDAPGVTAEIRYATGEPAKAVLHVA